jgi:hypothetical protein
MAENKSRTVTQEEYEDDDNVFIFSVTITKEEFKKATEGNAHQFMVAFNPAFHRRYTQDQVVEVSNNLSLYASHLVSLFRKSILDEKMEESKDALKVREDLSKMVGSGGGKLN